jgi:hypothetical protein
LDFQSVNNCFGDIAGKLDAEEDRRRGSKSPSPTHSPPETSLPDVPIITQEEVDAE